LFTDTRCQASGWAQALLHDNNRCLWLHAMLLFWLASLTLWSRWHLLRYGENILRCISWLFKVTAKKQEPWPNSLCCYKLMWFLSCWSTSCDYQVLTHSFYLNMFHQYDFLFFLHFNISEIERSLRVNDKTLS
jgi:hypothetical protein